MTATGARADAFGWLVSRPVAHRGLHDAKTHRIENTIAAAQAAIAADCAIECDVQLSRDREAMVFHDFTLDRLTAMDEAVADRTAAELRRLTLGNSTEPIPSLPIFLDAIGGRVPLICEIKSAFDGDMRLADRVVEIIQDYTGPIALKSFDPAVIAHLRADAARHLAHIPLGIVAEGTYDDPEWDFLPVSAKQRLAALAHIEDTRPDFLSYHVTDLPHAAAVLFRKAFRRPVMTWTVRTADQRQAAAAWADQMVFEGFVP